MLSEMNFMFRFFPSWDDLVMMHLCWDHLMLIWCCVRKKWLLRNLVCHKCVKNIWVQERFWEWFLRRSKNNKHNFSIEKIFGDHFAFSFSRGFSNMIFAKKCLWNNVLPKRFWERSLSMTFEKFQNIKQFTSL